MKFNGDEITVTRLNTEDIFMLCDNCEIEIYSDSQLEFYYDSKLNYYVTFDYSSDTLTYIGDSSEIGYVIREFGKELRL